MRKISDWAVVVPALAAFDEFAGLQSAVAEKAPWQIAAIHSGDWLLKTLPIAAMIGLWRGQRTVVAP